jgi:hypothetical protein
MQNHGKYLGITLLDYHTHNILQALAENNTILLVKIFALTFSISTVISLNANSNFDYRVVDEDFALSAILFHIYIE